MLDDMTILIVGGDQRYIEVTKELRRQNAQVYLAGFDELTEKIDATHVSLKDVAYNQLDALLLPVSGTDQTGRIQLAPFSSVDLRVTETHLKQTPDHCTIFTGVSNDFLNQLADRTNRELIRLFTRDDMAILNSIPTAEGTLSLAMNETDEIIHGSNVLILGFGRIGMTVGRLFSNVGAQVSVAARKLADLARIKEMGLQPVHMNQLDDVELSYDIFINTIPALIIDDDVLTRIQTEALIIDLASAPGGVDFQAAKQHGMTAIHALGLPGQVAPKSAGKMIAEVLIGLLDK